MTHCELCRSGNMMGPAGHPWGVDPLSRTARPALWWVGNRTPPSPPHRLLWSKWVGLPAVWDPTVQGPTASNYILEYPIPLLVLVTNIRIPACSMDLGNREWYHRSAGVKTTGKNSEYEKKSKQKNHPISPENLLSATFI